MAQVCSNYPYEWINLCHNIVCPQDEHDCTKAPNTTRTLLPNADHGSCYVLKYASPRSGAVGARGGWLAGRGWAGVLAGHAALAAGAWWWWWGEFGGAWL